MKTIYELRQFCAARGACGPAQRWLKSLPPDTPIRDALYALDPIRIDWLRWLLERARDPQSHDLVSAFYSTIITSAYIDQVLKPLNDVKDTDAVVLEDQFNQTMRPVVNAWLKEHEARILNALR